MEQTQSRGAESMAEAEAERATTLVRATPALAPVAVVVAPPVAAGRAEDGAAVIPNGGRRAGPARVPEAAPRLRRAVAEMLDRLLPCPFLIAVFPPWLLVVLGYHLLSDALPGGASPGKRLMGLRTVHYRDAARPCTPARAVLRNLPASAAHLMYGVGFLAPLALTLDVVDVLLVVCRPDGRRLGDLLAGTQVTATTGGGGEEKGGGDR